MVFKGKIARLQGWRAFIRITSLDGTEITPWFLELPIGVAPIAAGDEIELRIGKCNVDVTVPERDEAKIDALRDDD